MPSSVHETGGRRTRGRSGSRSGCGRSPRLLLGLLLPGVLACDSSDPIAPDPSAAASLEVVASGLDGPLYLTAAPGEADRLYVVERPGRIRIVENGSLVETPFLDITSITSGGGERGLLGLAFHPDYGGNGTFFVNHTDVAGDTRVVRYTVSPSGDTADPGSATELLQVGQPFSNHNGGQLAFGPDGMLYIGLGDGGSSGDPNGNGQDPSTLLGTILRIDVDGGAPYAIPADNPFADGADGAPEVWMYGLRNPWRFSFDATNGDIYVADVGQNEIEEVSVLSAAEAGGANLGWNVLEGTRCYDAETCDRTGLVLPAHEYTHDEGCSITGGYVYRGSAVPELEGRYFYGDYCGGWIRSFRLGSDGSATDVSDHTDAFGSVGDLASFGVDAAGELYVLGLDGTVHRMVPPSG
jgi:glucose/arabinose dehydrogenase